MNHALKTRGKGAARGVAATGPQDLCRLATTKYSLQTFRKPKEAHRAYVTVTAETQRFSSRVAVCVCVYVSMCVCVCAGVGVSLCVFVCLSRLPAALTIHLD